MQPETILNHLREILASMDDFRSRIPPDRILPEHRLLEDLGVDSVALLDLAVGLESHLGRTVDETELASLATVGAIARHFATREA